MKKRAALELAIRRHVDGWCGQPFVWGKSDCLLSICDIIRDARGYDPAKSFRGRYRTKIGALRVTREFGGIEGAIAAMAFDLDWREIAPGEAFVGDVGICAAGRAGLTGLIKDVQLWVGRNETAFSAVPTSRVLRAWRIR